MLAYQGRRLGAEKSSLLSNLRQHVFLRLAEAVRH